jgi:hypothetical protein
MGWALGLLLFFVPFALRGLGGGDVKLMAALGAWLGPTDVFWAAMYTGVAGGVKGAVKTMGVGGRLRSSSMMTDAVAGFGSSDSAGSSNIWLHSIWISRQNSPWSASGSVMSTPGYETVRDVWTSSAVAVSVCACVGVGVEEDEDEEEDDIAPISRMTGRPSGCV